MRTATPVRGWPFGHPRKVLEVRVRALRAGAELRQEESLLRSCDSL